MLGWQFWKPMRCLSLASQHSFFLWGIKIQCPSCMMTFSWSAALVHIMSVMLTSYHSKSSISSLNWTLVIHIFRQNKSLELYCTVVSTDTYWSPSVKLTMSLCRFSWNRLWSPNCELGVWAFRNISELPFFSAQGRISVILCATELLLLCLRLCMKCTWPKS